MRLDTSLSTGSGGRPFILQEWTVTTKSKNSRINTNLTKAFKKANGKSTFEVVAAHIPREEKIVLRVMVTLTNFLSLTASITVDIDIQVAAIPTAMIAGPTVLKVDRSRIVALQGMGVAPDCGVGQEKTDALIFAWRLTDKKTGTAVTKGTRQAKNPRLFRVDPNILLVRGLYIATLKVSSKRNPLLYNVAEVLIKVVPQPLMARIGQGERKLSVSAEETLSLSGALSIDPDVGNHQDLIFRWFCGTLPLVTATTATTAAAGAILRSDAMVDKEDLVPGKQHKIGL